MKAMKNNKVVPQLAHVPVTKARLLDTRNPFFIFFPSKDNQKIYSTMDFSKEDWQSDWEALSYSCTIYQGEQDKLEEELKKEKEFS